jgi:hypothetical protein
MEGRYPSQPDKWLPSWCELCQIYLLIESSEKPVTAHCCSWYPDESSYFCIFWWVEKINGCFAFLRCWFVSSIFTPLDIFCGFGHHAGQYLVRLTQTLHRFPILRERPQKHNLQCNILCYWNCMSDLHFLAIGFVSLLVLSGLGTWNMFGKTILGLHHQFCTQWPWSRAYLKKKLF